MREMFVMLCAFLVSSCGLKQLGEAVHTNEEGVWTSPSFGKYDRNSCYAVGLDYPDGYDWRSDPDKGKVKCQLVMFEDGNPVLRIQSGEERYISTESGRHRVICGHLYTDHTDGKFTTIKKDGHILYRYEGSETIEDIEIVDGYLHTLGILSEGGFTYRINGDVALERASGYLYKHMDVVSDTIVFYFRQHVPIAEGSVQTYYKVRNGKVTRLETDISGNAYDIRVSDDDDIYLSVDDEGYPTLISSAGNDVLKIALGNNIVSASIMNPAKPVVFIRYINSMSKEMADVLWFGGNDWKIYRMGRVLVDVFADDTGYYSLMNPEGDNRGMLYCRNTAVLMPEGYSVCSRGCMVRKDSIIYVGLSSADGKKPVIWGYGMHDRHETIDTLDINGPLICLQ